jgi:L-amino acid N-acyltransferase YncA
VSDAVLDPSGDHRRHSRHHPHLRRRRAARHRLVRARAAGRSRDDAPHAYAGYYRTRPAYRFTVEDSIYIAREVHRRGVGRALLERLIAESEKRGFRQMLAVIGDSAQTASIELHRAMGFRMIGAFENVGYKFGRWLDSVKMQRALGPGSTTHPDS